MRDPTTSTRRDFLGLAGGAAALGILPVVTLRPAEATPAMLAGAIRNVVGEAKVNTGRVKLDIPPLVENGNTVPMTVTVVSLMTADDHVKSIHVFNEKIRSPISAISISARTLAAHRFPPAFVSPTARRSLRLRGCRTTRSGQRALMSS